MKRIAYSFLLASLISSCGPSHPLNYLKLQLQDSQWKNCYLLSTRDTAIVVTPNEHSRDSIEIIPMDGIRAIYFQGSTTAAEWLSGPAGYVVSEIIFNTIDNSMKKNTLRDAISISCIPLGAYIGHLLTDKMMEYDPYSIEARELLHKRSKF